jgi:hypothetical protein
MLTINNMKKLLILSVFLFASLARFAEAETLSTGIFVDTGPASVNAVEGVIRVPASFEVGEISAGNSAVILWIEEPHFDAKSRTISFSGIAPGGFSGQKLIFSLSGIATPPEAPQLSFEGVHAFRNDGAGSAVPVRLFARAGVIAEDTLSPEAFSLAVSTSADLYGGQRFLTFLAQDKGTGVERYEYASTWLLSPREGDWQPAASPLLLDSRASFKKLYVRAIDNAGNVQVSEIPGTRRYATILLGLILIVCVLSLSRRSLP